MNLMEKNLILYVVKMDEHYSKEMQRVLAYYKPIK